MGLWYQFTTGFDWTIPAIGSTIYGMTDVQDIIARLRDKGWTVAAIADEMGVDYDTVTRWQNGSRSPNNGVAVKLALGQFMGRRRIPKRRRYTKKPPAP